MRHKYIPPTDSNLDALDRAISLFKNASELSRKIGVSRQSIHSWKSGRAWMSCQNAFLIENATDGKVKAIELIKR